MRQIDVLLAAHKGNGVAIYANMSQGGMRINTLHET